LIRSCRRTSTWFTSGRMVCWASFEVCTYSSETRVWRHRSSDRRRWQEGGGWGEWVNGGAILTNMDSAFVKGMQRFIIMDLHRKVDLIAAVDREGKTCRGICLPHKCSGGRALLIGQSQGLLHCVSEHKKWEGYCLQWAGLFVWVLEDYDMDKWVLKLRVTHLELFGKTYSSAGLDYNVLAIHPDRNMLFLHHCNKLMSYDMGSRELRTFHTLRSNHGFFTPYVPCFLDLPVLENKN
ncbi:hypothetical protein BAE44_0025134, partial [Dichanthelium oligosanthes]